MSLRCGPVVVLLLAGAIGPATATGTVVIDDFSDGPIALQAPPGTSATQTGLSGVVGGWRKWGFNSLGTAATSGASVRMNVDTAAGLHRYEADPDLTAVNFQLRYDGGGTTSAPAIDLDLTADGGTGIAIDFAYANFASGGGNFDITIGSRTGTTNGSVYYYQRVNNSAAPFRIVLPFVSPPGHPYENTLDPRHVTSFTLGTGNGNLRSGTYAIDRIYTVPEPGALTMAAFACAGAALARRRSQRR